MKDEFPKATVRVVDGQVILDDPVALEVMTAIDKHGCRNTLCLQAERMRYFVGRIAERGSSPTEVIVVLLNVDGGGKEVADVLMPGADWDEMRRRGETPFARGLAGRQGIQMFLDDRDAIAADKLRNINGVAIFVMDHGVCEVFDASALDVFSEEK